MSSDGTVIPQSESARKAPGGSVTFVGVGPGNPELLTLAGAAAIRAADVVFLEDASQAEFVGQLQLITPPELRVSCNEVGELIEPALAGQEVVRLIAGDLFADSQALELAQVLATPGIRVDVVPGVSCSTAIPGYAGVRVTNWAFVDAVDAVPLKWPQCEALVVRTSLDLLVEVEEVVDRPRDEQIVLVKRAGMAGQASFATTWAEIAEYDDEPEVVYIIASPEVADREAFSWFEAKPLFDWRVLVPVAIDQGGALSARLTSLGALPEEVPTMSIEPPRTEQRMEKAIRGLVDGRYKWIVFTSPNAVEGIRARFAEYGLDARSMSGIEIGAVGPQTAQALANWGIAADLMPDGEQTTSNLAAIFPAFDDMLDPINRVLVPRAEISTDLLLAGLESLGWEVEDVTAYRTVRAAPPAAETREAIKTGLFDAVVFASSSTVRNLIGIAGKPHASMVVAAIGTATAKTCEEFGLRVDAVAEQPTQDALADALAAFANLRKAEIAAKGVPFTKPSQRRRRRRKKDLTAS